MTLPVSSVFSACSFAVCADKLWMQWRWCDSRPLDAATSDAMSTLVVCTSVKCCLSLQHTCNTFYLQFCLPHNEPDHHGLLWLAMNRLIQFCQQCCTSHIFVSPLCNVQGSCPFVKIKFKHFQGPSDTDLRTFKDHVCFQGLSRPRKYEEKKSTTFKDPQEPWLIFTV